MSLLAPIQAPKSAPRYFALITIIICLCWTGISLLVVNIVFTSFIQNSIRDTQKEAQSTAQEQKISIITAINQMRTTLAVIGHPCLLEEKRLLVNTQYDALPMPQRKIRLENHPVLSRINHHLKASLSARDLISHIYIMNLKGIVTASSNAYDANSLVGSNFSSRQYFQEAIHGKEGYQYGYGALTHASGIYLSQPIWNSTSKQIIGVAVIKISTERFAKLIASKDDFLADANGVIIISHNQSNHLKTLPDATVSRIPEATRQWLYGRTSFDVFPITQWQGFTNTPFFIVGDKDVPRSMVKTSLENGKLLLFTMKPANNFGLHPWERYLIHIISLLLGYSIIVLALSTWFVRRHSQLLQLSIERQRQTEYHAMRDDLTGAYRRQAIDFLLDLAQKSGSSFAMMVVDLDNFKNINDAYGHQSGDEYLVEIVRRIRSGIRKNDAVVRYGGDEFMVLICNLASLEPLHTIIANIMEAIRQPFTPQRFDKTVLHPSASIGITIYPQDTTDLKTLFYYADCAMYYVKTNQRGHYAFYQPFMSDLADNKTPPREMRLF
ncbi:MAG: diguanylate cyclase [Burkholderiaceae bacterium]|jgi:diguanylate cyclase (GGDEF)-like protein|nr:diguanylate cyclase [Burkholderiaceae bacterium]